MLQYGSIDVYEGIDLNKIDSLYEFIICHYWYFLHMNFRFQSEVWNWCHGLIQKAKNCNVTTIFSVKGNDYRIHFLYMS